RPPRIYWTRRRRKPTRPCTGPTSTPPTSSSASRAISGRPSPLSRRASRYWKKGERRPRRARQMKVNVAPLLKQPIGAQMDYEVIESPIDPRGDNAGLIEAGISSIDADIVATHTNPGAYLEGDAHASLALPCSRC